MLQSRSLISQSNFKIGHRDLIFNSCHVDSQVQIFNQLFSAKWTSLKSRANINKKKQSAQWTLSKLVYSYLHKQFKPNLGSNKQERNSLFALVVCQQYLLRQSISQSSPVLQFSNTYSNKHLPWSSGYGRRLTFKRLWVQIPAPYTR